MPLSNTPRDVDEIIEVQVLKLYLVTVTCDKVQSYLKGLPRTSHVRTNQDIHSLRIGNGVTAPTSPLVPSEVEGLDTLSWHDDRVVEDESEVSWKACCLADRPASLLILSRPLPLCQTWLVNP